MNYFIKQANSFSNYRYNKCFTTLKKHLFLKMDFAVPTVSDCLMGDVCEKDVEVTPSHRSLNDKPELQNGNAFRNNEKSLCNGPSIGTPQQTRYVESVSATPHVSGEITLTPTYRSFTPQTQSVNPHSSMNAITPMASAVNQAKSSIKFQNCISTVSLDCELNLLDIYCRTRFSEYNPARFNGVVMKILDPRATALVFRSGKIVCTGAKNGHDSYIAARKFARIIQKLGFPVKFLDFKVLNFLATADLRFPIKLEALQQAHGQFTSYEPELFSGLVYRMIRPRVVLLIFVNGKMVITGAKTNQEVYEAVDIIHPILRSYKKN